MKVAVASFKDLGSNCWSAARFNGRCHTCKRYDACTYPERIANAEYDQLRSEAASLKKQSDEIYDRVRDMRGY
ncbi:MAG: hypothetical protein LPK02_07380 [Rhodobacterales bacterium]|nr:hypothetical protein [Rhodobacterales bacterium]